MAERVDCLGSNTGFPVNLARSPSSASSCINYEFKDDVRIKPTDMKTGPLPTVLPLSPALDLHL